MLVFYGVCVKFKYGAAASICRSLNESATFLSDGACRGEMLVFARSKEKGCTISSITTSAELCKALIIRAPESGGHIIDY